MEFRIITYNIFGARLTNGRELARSLKKYNPDFIGLQEVDRRIQEEVNFGMLYRKWHRKVM